MRTFLYLLFFLLPFFCLASGPATISDHIHIDQFGYRPSAQKVAIISDPQVGFNAAESFSPGTTYHVKRWSDDVTVFSAAITAWNGGATHAQSGDKVWWFDFSSVVMPGDYYIYDPVNDAGSYRFAIGTSVYNEALRQAMRMFYLQRCGVAKASTYAGDWSDAVCHTHALQDLNCRSVSDPNNPATEKDLSGGWHDAGDFNKYVNFTWSAVHDLLFAYQENSSMFGDDYNIPESGNGIPDILDEVKWELDWLLKMQQADGSVLMKVAVPCFESTSPASADLTQRMYGPAQSSATRVVASLFAHAYLIYSSLGNPSMTAYANTLKTKAELAWTWLENNPGASNYNNSGFCSASPEMSAQEQAEVKTGAAAMLFAATGNTTYRTYFDNNYTSINPYAWGYWYPFQTTIQDIMLYYAGLSNATTTVATNIKNNCINSVNSGNDDLLEAWLNQTDAYRAYLKNGDYVWGSNRWKANAALVFYNMVTYDLYPSNNTHYINAAENFLHFLHGANPINQLMLTNMGDYDAENSCNEMYHAWFGDGTVYDNAQTSPIGPPPGFVTGGFNPNYQPDPSYPGTISPPENQPHQKSYKDWNTSWPENSWELTEPAIYSQAAYVKLVSKFAGSFSLPVELEKFGAALQTDRTVLLHWSTLAEQGFDFYEIERSTDGKKFEGIGKILPKGNQPNGDSYSFIDSHPNVGMNYHRLKMNDLDGSFSNSDIAAVNVPVGLEIAVRPNPVKGFFEIKGTSTPENLPLEISLQHFSGKEVFSEIFFPNSGQWTEQFSTAECAPGLYILKVSGGNERFFEKVVVVK